MLKNHLRTAWRNLSGNKFYSSISILGLAIGLAVGVMILWWVQDEFSFDRFNRKAAQIYKINSHLGKGSNHQVWTGSPSPLALYCRQSIKEVVNTVRIKFGGDQTTMSYGENKIGPLRTAYTDPSIFSVFDFKLLKGDPTRPFPDNQSIVITSSTARKFFGNADPIGKVLLEGNTDHFVVAGVMEDFPENSSIHYDILFPMALYAKAFQGNGDWKTIDEDLGDYYYEIYLLLQRQASASQVGTSITKLFHDKRKDQITSDVYFSLQSLTSLHLVAPDGSKSALQTVRIFLLVGLLILAIASINYINISTARSMLRAKEVSVRKIIGAARIQLFIQFMLESTLLFFLASVLALVILYLMLPFYNNLSGKQFSLSLGNTALWLVIFGALLGSIIGGSVYPAILLSSFKPIESLRGKAFRSLTSASFRKVLVVTQFVFSVILIVGTLVIGNQLRYIRQKDIGFDRQQIFGFGMQGNMHDHYDAFRNELLHKPGILGVASANDALVGDPDNTTGDTFWDGKEPGTMFLIHPYGIDKDFIPLVKLKLLAGENFKGEKSDSARFILNETAVREMGIKNPIGKAFTLWQSKGIITGIVKDFNYSSLRFPVQPTIFYCYPPNWSAYVKTDGQQVARAIQSAKETWEKYTKDASFSYTFLDDEFEKLYKSETRAGVLFNIFSVVAIVISCLGLIGLSTYTAQVKTKEIGIRKVLGATVASIANLLVKDFVSLILIAFVLGSAIAWFAMNKWLENFAYRVPLSWWIFGMTAVIILAIALLTTLFQTIKAAVANPVESLRTE